MTLEQKQHLTEFSKCAYEKICSGCQFLHTPYDLQMKAKIQQLTELLALSKIRYDKKIHFESSGTDQLRDRLDFSLQNGHLGLYAKETNEIVDIETCAQLSPDLNKWLNEFRTFQFPFKKGSIRLRIGPNKQKGVWLDFANIDIKSLLTEKSLLQRLQSVAFVEIGQRRKVPVWNGSEYKLQEPLLNPWFQSWIDETPVDLYCQVASFSQPSLKANKIICNVISKWIKLFKNCRLIEFGSGIGNLTLPALAYSESLLACEVDALSLQGLEKTMAQLPTSLQSLKSKLTIHRGDFQKKIKQDFSEIDGVLVNPPRSGLMKFLNPLQALSPEQRPSFFIYMSCFAESMMTDLSVLQDLQYDVEELIIVDQFPQTKHYEVLCLLKRK